MNFLKELLHKKREREREINKLKKDFDNHSNFYKVILQFI